MFSQVSLYQEKAKGKIRYSEVPIRKHCITNLCQAVKNTVVHDEKKVEYNSVLYSDWL